MMRKFPCFFPCGVSLAAFATPLLFLWCAGSVQAASGPQHKSLRPLSMGNAFVALAEGRDALHYNPAGLNRIPVAGRLTDRMEARATLLSLDAPWAQAREGWGLYRKESSSGFDFEDDYDSTVFEDFSAYDRRPFEVAALQAFEFATHDFGVAYWGESRVTRSGSFGILLPQAFESVQTDAVLQASLAHGFWDGRLALGVGYRLANRRETYHESSYAEDPENGQPIIVPVQDTLNGEGFDNSPWDYDISTHGTRKSAQHELARAMMHPHGWDDFGHGLDLGVLWRQNGWLQCGAAAQNVGMRLNGKYVTPEITVGTAAGLNIGPEFDRSSRHLNFALDYEDVLNEDLEWLSRVNLGAEVLQNFGDYFEAGLGAGFKGGYWTAGARIGLFSVLHVELVSWAEEIGAYTGDLEDRHYAFELSLGI